MTPAPQVDRVGEKARPEALNPLREVSAIVFWTLVAISTMGIVLARLAG